MGAAALRLKAWTLRPAATGLRHQPGVESGPGESRHRVVHADEPAGLSGNQQAGLDHLHPVHDE
jgi:hypothetical protein